MQFSIRQISIKDAFLVDCHFSLYKLNKAILQKWLIEWIASAVKCVIKEGRVINNKASRLQSLLKSSQI